jgi:hypothetical protein
VPYPWAATGRYDGAEYELNHMANLVREITCGDGQVRPVEFRFSYHCFTETDNRAGDIRTRFVDPEFPSERRVFCPHRWFLSRRLREYLSREIDGERLIEDSAFQWMWRKAVPGISKPYAVYLKFGVPLPRGPIIVNVNTAYIKTDFRRQKDSEMRFSALLTVAAVEKRIPGKA